MRWFVPRATKHRHSVAQVITWVVITFIYVIATLKVLDQLNLPIGSLVAPATVLGAALGFGAQRVVQDILAGFFIITERQYGFGDTVRLAITGSSDDAEGVIEDVTLRVTRMRNSDGEVITVPNGQIVESDQPVQGLGTRRHRRSVPVPATADLTRVNEVLRQVGVDAMADRGLKKTAARRAHGHGRRKPGGRSGQRADGRAHTPWQTVPGRTRSSRPRRRSTATSGDHGVTGSAHRTDRGGERMTDQEPRRGLDRLFHLDWLPSRIFGGRMRTSTFILIVAWILTYLLHTYLNPEDPTAVTPPPSVDTSQTEPYVAPSVKPSTTTPVPSSTEPTTTSETPVSGIEHGQLRFSDADFGSRACAGQRRTVRDHGADHSATTTVPQPGAAMQAPTSVPQSPATTGTG